MTPTTIREPVPTDQAYIAKGWLRSMEMARDRKGKKPSVFYDEWGPVVDRILDRKDTRVLVAERAKDGEPYIAGWVVWTPTHGVPVLHYLYVRRDDRTQGVATSLLAHAGLHRGAMMIYTLFGPCHRWLVEKAPAAIHVTASKFLGGSK